MAFNLSRGVTPRHSNAARRSFAGGLEPSAPNAVPRRSMTGGRLEDGGGQAGRRSIVGAAGSTSEIHGGAGFQSMHGGGPNILGMQGPQSTPNLQGGPTVPTTPRREDPVLDAQHKKLGMIDIETRVKAAVNEALKPVYLRLQKFDERTDMLAERIDTQAAFVNELSLIQAKDTKFRLHLESLAKDVALANQKIITCDTRQKDSSAILRTEVEQLKLVLDKQDTEAKVVSQCIDRLNFDIREMETNHEEVKTQLAEFSKRGAMEQQRWAAQQETKLRAFESTQYQMQDEMFLRERAAVELSAENKNLQRKIEECEKRLGALDEGKASVEKFISLEVETKVHMDQSTNLCRALEEKMERLTDEAKKRFNTVSESLITYNGTFIDDMRQALDVSANCSLEMKEEVGDIKEQMDSHITTIEEISKRNMEEAATSLQELRAELETIEQKRIRDKSSLETAMKKVIKMAETLKKEMSNHQSQRGGGEREARNSTMFGYKSQSPKLSRRDDPPTPEPKAPPKAESPKARATVTAEQAHQVLVQSPFYTDIMQLFHEVSLIHLSIAEQDAADKKAIIADHFAQKSGMVAGQGADHHEAVLAKAPAKATVKAKANDPTGLGDALGVGKAGVTAASGGQDIPVIMRQLFGTNRAVLHLGQKVPYMELMQNIKEKLTKVWALLAKLKNLPGAKASTLGDPAGGPLALGGPLGTGAPPGAGAQLGPGGPSGVAGPSAAGGANQTLTPSGIAAAVAPIPGDRTPTGAGSAGAGAAGKSQSKETIMIHPKSSMLGTRESATANPGTAALMTGTANSATIQESEEKRETVTVEATMAKFRNNKSMVADTNTMALLKSRQSVMLKADEAPDLKADEAPVADSPRKKPKKEPQPFNPMRSSSEEELQEKKAVQEARYVKEKAEKKRETKKSIKKLGPDVPIPAALDDYHGMF